jgi:hypothetical protein
MRVEVFNHQMTIDFLNESLQQEANVDLTSIDYMEKIKQINIDWIRIKSLISARIDVRILKKQQIVQQKLFLFFIIDFGTIE